MVTKVIEVGKLYYCQRISVIEKSFDSRDIPHTMISADKGGVTHALGNFPLCAGTFSATCLDSSRRDTRCGCNRNSMQSVIIDYRLSLIWSPAAFDGNLSAVMIP